MARYTEEEDQQILDLLEDGRSFREISKEIGRSFAGTQTRIRKLKNERDPNKLKPIRKEWTQEEDDFLKQFANVFSRQEIAKQLNRSVESVTGRVRYLNLSNEKREKGKEWSIEEIELLKKVKQKELTCRQAAEILDRTLFSVRAGLQKYG